MSDISDLHGVYATPLRWKAEAGILGYDYYDETTGERAFKEIELGSLRAQFAMDLATRERGYGLIRKNVYDMRLTPVNSPPPPWPDDEDFKVAIGVWMWNPALGEVRLETNGSMFLRAICALWDKCRMYKEASDGMQPVIHFIGRYERHVEAVGRTFWVPTIEIIGWMPRDKTPFSLREPTVKPPLALDSQVAFGLLNAPRQEEPVRSRGKAKAAAAPKGSSLGELLDDEIPEL
jgi:hypothetical protein